jgi:hypothetical protein
MRRGASGLGSSSPGLKRSAYFMYRVLWINNRDYLAVSSRSNLLRNLLLPTHKDATWRYNVADYMYLHFYNVGGRQVLYETFAYPHEPTREEKRSFGELSSLHFCNTLCGTFEEHFEISDRPCAVVVMCLPIVDPTMRRNFIEQKDYRNRKK